MSFRKDGEDGTLSGSLSCSGQGPWCVGCFRKPKRCLFPAFSAALHAHWGAAERVKCRLLSRASTTFSTATKLFWEDLLIDNGRALILVGNRMCTDIWKEKQNREMRGLRQSNSAVCTSLIDKQVIASQGFDGDGRRNVR